MLGLCKSSTPAPLSKGGVFWCLGRKMSKMSGKVCTDVNAGCWINCTDISLTMYLDSWFTDLDNWMYVFKLFNHPSRTFHHDLQHLLSKNAKPWIPRSKTTKMWRDAARTWPLSLPARWCVMMSHDRTIFMFKLLDSVFPDSTYTKPRSPADFATLAVDPWETPRQLFRWLVSTILGLKLSPSNRGDLLPKINRVLTVLCWQVFQGKAFNDLRPRERQHMTPRCHSYQHNHHHRLMPKGRLCRGLAGGSSSKRPSKKLPTLSAARKSKRSWPEKMWWPRVTESSLKTIFIIVMGMSGVLSVENHAVALR